MDFSELYERAKQVVNPRKLSNFADAGGVGAALLSESGTVYLRSKQKTPTSKLPYSRSERLGGG